jgi:hypothetical protein
MKKLILLPVTLFLVTHLFGQTDALKRNTLQTSFAVNWYYDCYFSDGLSYIRRETDKRSWSVGIEHSYWEEKFRRSVTVPLRIIRHFRRPIFLNYGLLLNMDSFDFYGVRTERYFNCGAEFGMGYEQTFPAGISLSIFPHVRMIGFCNENTELSCRAGISVGIGYKF